MRCIKADVCARVGIFLEDGRRAVRYEVVRVIPVLNAGIGSWAILVSAAAGGRPCGRKTGLQNSWSTASPLYAGGGRYFVHAQQLVAQQGFFYADVGELGVRAWRRLGGLIPAASCLGSSCVVHQGVVNVSGSAAEVVFFFRLLLACVVTGLAIVVCDLALAGASVQEADRLLEAA